MFLLTVILLRCYDVFLFTYVHLGTLYCFAKQPNAYTQQPKLSHEPHSTTHDPYDSHLHCHLQGFSFLVKEVIFRSGLGSIANSVRSVL